MPNNTLNNPAIVGMDYLEHVKIAVRDDAFGQI